ncbi:hypothetical protein ACVSQB_08140 [Bradyrhizobium elkanii]
MNPTPRVLLNLMVRRAAAGLLLCLALAACDGSSTGEPLPAPGEQASFQRAWDARSGHFGAALKELPRELNGWVGKVLFKSTVNNKIQLFVIQIADDLAVVGFGYSNGLPRANADEYVQFSATQFDDPAAAWYNSDQVQVAGIRTLVKVKLDRIMTPRTSHPTGW